MPYLSASEAAIHEVYQVYVRIFLTFTKFGDASFSLLAHHVTHRQTDRQTDRQTADGYNRATFSGGAVVGIERNGQNTTNAAHVVP